MMTAPSTPLTLPYSRMEVARSSPAGMATVCSQGMWRATRHLLYLNRQIIDVTRRKDGRKLVQIPIRHGKSELLSAWTPAWYLGENPNESLLWISYDQSMARKYGGRARNIFEQFGPQLWGLQLAQDTHAKHEWNVAGHAGSFFGTSFRGGFGSRAAHGIIIDDPFGSDKDANNKAERDRVWQVYRESVYGRLEPGGWMIVASARWHEQDLIGMLYKVAIGETTGDDIDPDEFGRDEWDLIDMPAIALENDQLGREPGEALWPERYPIERLRRMRGNMGPRAFNAQVMCRPTGAISEYFPRNFFRYYKIQRQGDSVILAFDGTFVRLSDCDVYSCVDLAGTEGGGDYFVIGTFARQRNVANIFVLDIYRRQIAGPKHIPAMVEVFAKWRPSVFHVEGTGMQKLKVQEAQASGLPVVSFNPALYGDKLTRAEIASTRYEAGMVMHPIHSPHWLPALEDELTEFPTGRKDQVDVVSMGCIIGAEKARDTRAVAFQVSY
jgi:phage terminase large subunit-like protein